MNINKVVEEILKVEQKKDEILDFLTGSESRKETLKKYPVSKQQLKFWKKERDSHFRLQALSREELLKVIHEEETNKTKILYEILKDVHNIDIGDIIGRSVSKKMQDIFITATLLWEFQIIVFYMYELGRYFKKLITVNGKWEYNEISEEEFNQCKNASAIRNHDGQMAEFGIEISSIWQSGIGDDLAVSIEEGNFIMVFDDVHTNSRSLSPLEINGIQLLASFLREKFKSRKDPLTNILNRRSYEEHLSSGTHQKGYFFMLDADHFKKVNDTYGHAFGDFVLKKIASVLKELIRERDKVYRWGGEEFLVWLDSFSIEEEGIEPVLAIAERVRKKIENTSFTQKDTTMRLTISIGVSMLDTTKAEIRTNKERLALAKEAIESADNALYRAKENGRNLVEHNLKKNIS